jgi:hypothetical protein
MPKRLEFNECDTCRVKPGSPTLCSGCLHNRAVIEELRSQVSPVSNYRYIFIRHFGEDYAEVYVGKKRYEITGPAISIIQTLLNRIKNEKKISGYGRGDLKE